MRLVVVGAITSDNGMSVVKRGGGDDEIGP